MDRSHSTNLYYRGKGILKFDRLDDDGLPTGLRDLGNAPDFSLGTSEETSKHYSAREGVKTLDKEDTLTQELSGAFTLEEFDIENLQMALLADKGAFFIRPMSASNIEGALDFWGTNTQGPKFHIQLWKVKIKNNSKLGMISENIGSIPFEFTVESDLTNHPNDPYGLITPLAES
jgi:hypothetical protein